MANIEVTKLALATFKVNIIEINKELFAVTENAMEEFIASKFPKVTKGMYKLIASDVPVVIHEEDIKI